MNLAPLAASIACRPPDSDMDLPRPGPQAHDGFAPGAALAVVVRAGASRQPDASLDGPTLTVALPAADVAAWAEDDREGLYGRQDAGPGRTLRIATEKDYTCDHRDAPARDVLPRPDA